MTDCHCTTCNQIKAKSNKIKFISIKHEAHSTCT